MHPVNGNITLYVKECSAARHAHKWPRTFPSQLSEDFANTFLFNDFLVA